MRRSLLRILLAGNVLALSAAERLPASDDAWKIELKGVYTKKPDATAEGEVMVQMGLWAIGIPSRYVLRVERTHVTLETPAGEKFPSKSYATAAARVLLDVNAVQAALGETKLFASNPLDFHIVPVFSMRGDLLARHWRDWLVFSAKLDIQACEYSVRERFPLREQKGTLLGHIGQDSVHLRREANAVTLRISRQVTGGEGAETLGGGWVFVLENPKRQEALLGNEITVISDHPASPPKAGTEWQFSNADSPTGRILHDDWLADARLLVLAPVPRERFSRTVRIDPFQLSYDIPAQLGRPGDVNETALDQIKLPPGPTNEQVRAYVDAIVSASRQQKTSGYDDPQVEMLLKVGPDRLDVLMDAAPNPRSPKDLHLWKAMRQIVQKQPRAAHREQILSRLESNPGFAELLIDESGFESPLIKEARPILLKGLREERGDLTASWIKAVLTFREPETYPALLAYYEKNPGEPGLYESIRLIPGMDLQGSMERIWSKAKQGTIRQQSFVLHPACELGVADALHTAAGWLKNPVSDYQARVGRAVLKKFTPANGKDADLLVWYEANRTGLRFDKDRKLFLPDR